MLESSGTRDLARAVCATRSDALPAAVADAARRCVVDTVGVLIAGAGTDAGALIEQFAARRGVARLPWHPLLRSGPADAAALAYGTLGHALDFDDGLPGAAHASVPVLAAIIGSASGPLSSARLVEAFVAGWETTARVTRALGPGHYRRGWHTTGTAAAFGATAAAGRLGGLTESETATAFGIAGSLAAGLQRNFGTMTKPLHSGIAAANGVTAAELAALGFTADGDILDGPGGFLDVYRGPAAVEAGPGLDLGEGGWGRYAIVDPGVIVKSYPCCYASARAVDAALRLRPGIDPDGIESIECAGPAGAFRALRYRNPVTGLEAKFSLEYAVAAALLDGIPGLDSFTDAAVARPAARRLVARTTVTEEARCRPADPDGTHSSPATGGFVELRVRLANGATRTAVVSEARGSPGDPLSWEEIEAKYLGCLASAGIDPAAAAELLRRLRSRDHPDVLGHTGLADSVPEGRPGYPPAPGPGSPQPPTEGNIQ